MSALLVDSSFYIDLLRARRDPVEALRPWLVQEEIVCCGVIRCEVLRGVISKKVSSRMRELFAVVSRIDIDESVWDEVARLAWRLDRRGVVIPLSGLVIACCAFRAGATVVSSDDHFRQIPGLAVAGALPKR